MCIVVEKQDILRYSVKIHDGREAENALSDNEFPAQSTTTVASDVALDLWEPEREISEAYGVSVKRAERNGPGCGVQGEEDQAQKEKIEF